MALERLPRPFPLHIRLKRREQVCGPDESPMDYAVVVFCAYAKTVYLGLFVEVDDNSGGPFGGGLVKRFLGARCPDSPVISQNRLHDTGEDRTFVAETVG